MQKAGIPIRRYAYDAVNHMVSGKNLENGEKTSYTYNALGMRTNLTQTLLGKDAFKTREVSYLPDYLSGTANDLVAYEQGQVLRYAERNIWGDLKLPVHNDLNISGIEDSLRFTSYAYDPVIGKYFAQARFYDSRQGRMLSKDPIKRDINGYPYCNNDPVNCVDPTGEIANVLIGGAIGGL
ncbi:MAG: RHS repeat-associated core domain-containing protein, partial [Lachnospiraceae bacterium]|nr:RHS repeat-associated core domain-containing protein [Lachnospiraceae bacterium]